MRYVCSILAALFYLAGFGGCMMAKSAIGEIQGTLMIVIGTLFFIGSGIIEGLDNLIKELRKPHPPQ